MQFSDFAKGSLGMIALLFGGEPALPQTFDRLEIHSFQSATPTNKQFLTGEANVKPALLSAELRIPKPGTAKLPAIVLIHDSGGISSSHDRWAQALNAIGVAVLVVDSFTGRGIVRTIDDQSLLDPGAMMIDAYRALALLAQHQRIDSSRIAVIGSRRARWPQFIRAISGFAPFTVRQIWNLQRILVSTRRAMSPTAMTQGSLANQYGSSTALPTTSFQSCRAVPCLCRTLKKSRSKRFAHRVCRCPSPL